MKRLIFIIIFGNSLLVYSQSILNPTNTIDWGINDNSDETKQLLISKINESLGNQEGTLPKQRARGTLSNYHVFDITEDGLLDLIYSGPYGEGSAVILYENRGTNFIESDFIPGQLIGLSRLDLSRTIEIKTHLFPCCAGVWHYLKTVVVNSTESGIDIIMLNEDVYMDYTDEPTNTMKSVLFETVNEQYKLRSTPNIVNEFSRWPDTIDGGNTLAIYPKGSRGRAYGKSTDETGRVWWFVIMENNFKPINSLMYYDNDPKGTRSYGWMSSSYVKQIESR